MTLHEKIREELLERLAGMTPGTRFPSEPELSREFGVARMTVNKVVEEFAKEGRIIRERGRGTFAAAVPVERQVVTFLLPCAEFLSKPTSYLLRALASGVTEEARKCGAGVELVAVSPTNDARDIDFSALSHLKEKSCVIVPFCWFHPLFPFLAERKCRTLLIDRQQLQRKPNCEFTRNFLLIDNDVKKGISDSVKRLYENGCRRIALLSYYREDKAIQFDAYSETIHAFDLPELSLSRDPDAIQVSPSEKQKLRAFGCDGLIFDAYRCTGLSGNDFAAAVGLPPGISLEIFRFPEEANFLREIPATFQLDMEKIGSDALRMLLGLIPAQNELVPLVYIPAHKAENQLERMVI